VLAWPVGSASTVTGRTGSGRVIAPVAGTARMFACAWLRSRRSRSSRDERLSNTFWKNGTAAAWTDGPRADGHERPHAARVLGVVMAAGHVAIGLLGDHRLVGDALDERAARGNEARDDLRRRPSLMKPRCAKVISHSVVRAPRLASERS
jgi:hypothetical protein